MRSVPATKVVNGGDRGLIERQSLFQKNQGKPQIPLIQLLVYLCVLSLTIACFTASATPTDNYDYIEIQRNATPTRINKCTGIPFSVYLTDSGIKLKSASGELVVRNELEEASVEAIVGDFWDNQQCFIALKTAESDVNESYDVYAIARSSAPNKVSGIPSIVNPDFVDGSVISSYRDAARWHKEKICYTQGQSPHLCEKRDSLDDNIESVKKCTTKDDCRATGLVFSTSGKLVSGQVTSSRVFIMQISSDEEATPLRSYLVKGDRVKLLDFKSIRGTTYYQIEYDGKRTTAGWLNADDIAPVE